MNRRKFLGLSIMGSLLLPSALRAMTSIALPQAKRVIVLGWDGAGLNNVQPMVEAGYLPNLKALLDSGGVLMHLEPLSGTGTVPNWSVAWTGQTYQSTGLGGNHKYLGGEIRQLNYWLHQLRWERTILSRIKRTGTKIGWIVTKHFMGDPDSSPFTQIWSNVDYFRYFPFGEKYIDLETLRARDFVKANEGNDYLLFVLTNPDTYGHAHGEDSERYLQEFVRSDTMLGELMYVTRNDPDVRFCVISDHGFDPGAKTHLNAPDNFFATSLPVDPKWVSGGGTMRDFASTMLDYWGMLSLATDGRYGKSLLLQA